MSVTGPSHTVGLPLRMVLNVRAAVIGAGLAMAAAILPASLAEARDLRIATLAEPTSADPHFYLFAGNDALRRYSYESLVSIDRHGTVQPQLAQSWKNIDDTHWEFKLRPDVVFHDGRRFSAQDVIYSICRIRNNVTQGSFARYTAQIKRVETPDPLTLVVDTETPYPLLLTEISLWGVVSAPADVGPMDLSKKDCGLASFPTNADFDNGKAANGTGPYRLERFQRGSEAQFARFDKYWGPKPDWDHVILKPISSTAARVAALLAGDVDVIEAPTPQDYARISGDQRFGVASAPNYDVRFLMFDSFAEPSPGIQDTDGRNPFKDVRVRKAVSMAVNRKGLIDRILGGHGIVATNLQGPESFGFNDSLKAPDYNPAEARRLLAEAGYPNGFKVSLGVSADYDGTRVGQAIAQMLTQIGIRTEVDNAPTSVFFSKRAKYEYSLYSYVVGARTAEQLTALRVLLGTVGSSPGFGGINGGRYSNKALDALLLKAQTTIDEAARRKLLQDANRLAMDDYALVLLDQRVNLWAFRRDVTYVPGVDGYTLAADIHPAH
jgi:peptide/nickel transport system substrate-binding protein